MTDRRPSRREFLKATAAVAGAPYAITSAALGGPGGTPAGDRIGLGFIGVGGMGSGHLSSFLGRRECRVLAVADVDARHRDRARQRVERAYGTGKGVLFTGDFRELIAREDIDGVVTALPDHWHAIPAIMAMKAGKDVYGEKPLSLTVREGRAMLDAARRYGRVFQTGSQTRSNGSVRHVCELVLNGRIGKVKEIYVNCGGPPRPCRLPAEAVPDYLDWEMWVGPGPMRPYHHGLHPYSWRSYREYSGGQIANFGAHRFDLAQWALGMDDSGPVEVRPAGGGRPLTYVYADGTRMYRRPGPHGGQVHFVGTEGELRIGPNASWPPHIIRQAIGPGQKHLYRSGDHRGDWLRCMRTRRRPVADVAVGYRTVTICHIGSIATFLGRALKWDPSAEDFVGDPEASRRLARPKRAPWRT